MKNVVVSAASLRMGGAVTIYNQFIKHLREEIGDCHYFIFVNKVVSTPDIDGVRYYVIDIESRSKRQWFDNKGCKEILNAEGFNPDYVISLQNTGVKCLAELPQLVYYHQSLPFFNKSWNPFKKDERSKFLYKHFYLHFVRKTITSHTHFAVQTKIMKENLVKRLSIAKDRVHVCFPDVDLPDIEHIKVYPFPEDKINLIYPSLYAPHKEHKVLLNALSLMKQVDSQRLKDVRLYFTVNIDEAPNLCRYVKKNNLNDIVVFMGRLPYEETLSLYRSAHAMLFPSPIETLGLPLIEAAAFGLKIVAPDVPYAHEVLEGYEGVEYAISENPKSWAERIAEVVKQPKQRYSVFHPKNKEGWKEFFNLFSDNSAC